MFSTITRRVLTASTSLTSVLQAPSWEGRVSAIFHTSLQLLGPGDTLMHLQGGPFLVSPFSLRVGGSLAECLRDGCLVVGMAVLKHGIRIEIGRLTLVLASTRDYRSPDPPGQRLDRGGVSVARQILGRSGRADGLTQIPGGGELLARLQQALADHHTGHLLAISQKLIGLGPGLTPSGDDVLVGCLKGLWLCAGTDRHLRTTLALGRQTLLPILHERTTAVGAAFIRHALHGQFAEVLDRAAEALFVPTDPEVVTSTMTRLLAQGETSGTDTALGLLLCLEAFLNG